MATAHCMTLGMYLVSYPPAFPNVCCLPKMSFFRDSHILSQLQQFGFLLQTSLSSLFVVVIFFFFVLLSFADRPFMQHLIVIVMRLQNVLFARALLHLGAIKLVGLLYEARGCYGAHVPNMLFLLFSESSDLQGSSMPILVTD